MVEYCFACFAEDTTICKQQLQDYIEGRTAEDGSDLASKLQRIISGFKYSKEKRLET
jgi:hypothetical protein